MIGTRYSIHVLFINLALLIFTISPCCCLTLYEDYAKCRQENTFGNSSFVCDTEHRLQSKVVQQLEQLLADLQERVICDCLNNCSRGDGLMTKFMPLMIVTTSMDVNVTDSKQNDMESALKKTMKKIYAESKLGDESCDNGLVIVYLKDLKKLATYRGNDRFMFLDEKEMAKLHELSTKGVQGEEEQQLGTSQSSPKEVKLGFPENLIPLIGLILALLLILMILCLLLCIFTRICCRRHDPYKSKYHINPMLSHYKSVDPIYIATPAASLRGIPTPHPDIYAPFGPYSSSPMYPYQIPTHSPHSRSATPTSAHRTKRILATTDHYGTASTPQAKKRDVVRTSTPQTHIHENHESNGRTSVLFDSAPIRTMPNNGGIVARERKMPALPFLDPHRKREVQTKEEFIG